MDIQKFGCIGPLVSLPPAEEAGRRVQNKDFPDSGAGPPVSDDCQQIGHVDRAVAIDIE